MARYYSKRRKAQLSEGLKAARKVFRFNPVLFGGIGWSLVSARGKWKPKIVLWSPVVHKLTEQEKRERVFKASLRFRGHVSLQYLLDEGSFYG